MAGEGLITVAAPKHDPRLEAALGTLGQPEADRFREEIEQVLRDFRIALEQSKGIDSDLRLSIVVMAMDRHEVFLVPLYAQAAFNRQTFADKWTPDRAKHYMYAKVGQLALRKRSIRQLVYEYSGVLAGVVKAYQETKQEPEP